MSQLAKSVWAFSVLLLTVAVSFAQQDKRTQSGSVPKGWHLLDRSKDGFQGISIDRAYEFVKSRNLKSKTIVVAVIDSGIDTLHEDLKNVLWRNSKEIPGNGKDDDENGYVDDVYGWNFLGGKDGRNVNQDSDEASRVYHSLKEKYSNKEIDTAALKGEELEEYVMWSKARTKIEGNEPISSQDLLILRRAYNNAVKCDSILRKALNKDQFTGNDLASFEPTSSPERTAKGSLLYLFRANELMESSNKEFLEGFENYLNGEERKAESKQNGPKNYRQLIVQDDENDINDRNYGNPDVMAGTPFHGTHVAGIIGAARGNDVGIDGIADNVRIMMLRAVPDGDEHDKDVALAIRYAVDNGAKVINMSFGKDFSPQKKWVDDAVLYAQSKGVLLVHAAGNDAKNIDSADNFPNATIRSLNKPASNWITVGASGDPKAGGYTANFSNYGKDQVDVFAPGVRIYSTIPGGNTYGDAQGTSMASPVVAGTAAFLLSYFPTLTAEQLKYCIEKSCESPADKVKKPGTTDYVQLSDISKSGGVINAYEAAKVAASLVGEEAPVLKPKKAPKTILKNSKG